jgi:hypothetical protein
LTGYARVCRAPLSTSSGSFTMLFRFDLFPRSWLRFAGLDHHAGNRNGFRDD